ncbi:glycosyltransferase [Stutzerimonas stutzeri]|uniref:glycosyltransferase n=1 Tax=Stutzerimonas stutzeri TaxID=316 RepID=UPI0024B6FA08|nr:glycosyltransferase [Stutzerimonas stutzeri]MDI9738106.1 glycosyltransferase [Stutzerimonas stutzeri]
MFSVLISVYCKENPDNFDGALRSIWTVQTLKPEQIVLVKDGPLTPELDRVVSDWKLKLGQKLTVVLLERNMGLAAALNEGLKYCNNELVARMDTDDLALPDRFEKQVNFMLSNPDVAVSSGHVEEWDEGFSVKISERRLPLDHASIVEFAKKRSPISHPAVIFRKTAVLDVGGYPSIYPEDYPLWGTMMAKGYKFANLPDVLLKMRVGNALVERRGKEFLKGEIKVFEHLYAVGLINKFELMRNIVVRSFVRLSPVWLKKILYKYFR